MKNEDVINHPSHYTYGKIECIDFIQDKKLNFLLGNAVKYIVRCQYKNDGKNKIEDLKKAIFYLCHQIEEWEKTKDK